MEMLLENFIKKKINTNYEVGRLADRAKREGFIKHRKNVYLIKSSIGCFVLLHFSKNYQIIFKNYLTARSLLEERILQELWVIDKQNQLILMPYFGKNYKKIDKNSFYKIVSFLHIINSPRKKDNFIIPRYLIDLVKLNKESRIFQLPYLNQLLFFLTSSKKKYLYGPGILDPAFKNFTHQKGKIYLVDLDNFLTTVNLSYEIGFLLADTNYLSKPILSSFGKVNYIYQKLPQIMNLAYIGGL